MTLEEMRARRADIEARLRAINDEAGDNDLTPEQTEEWRTLTTEHGDLGTQVEAEEEAQRIRAQRQQYGTPRIDADPLGEPDGIRQRFRGNPWDLDQVTRSLHREEPERGGGDLRARALGAVEHVQGVSDRSKQHITQLLEGFDYLDDEAEGRGARQVAAHIVATSSPEYMRAWAKAFKTGMRSGQPDVDALRVLQRAASLTDAAGGYAVPLPIDPTLIINDDGSVSPMRQISTVRTVVTDQLRTVNATAVSASYDAEAAEVSDDTPTWANTDISIYMARAFIPHSIEIGMDYPGFTGDVSMLLANAKMNLENTKFVLGSGTNEPIGIVTALTGGSFELTSTTTDTFALADVYKLEENLPEQFEQNAAWLANKKIYSAIRQAGGANLDDFWVGLRDGRPSSMLGYPPYAASAMDGVVNATQENRVLILGDFRWFWIVDRIGFSMELIPHLFHTSNNRPSGQRGVFAWWRNGSDSVLDRAFRMLNVT
jgi:HK97 family phage major capsid protein